MIRTGADGTAATPGRKRMFEAASSGSSCLKLIADEPRHGYDCIRAIEEHDRRRICAEPGRRLSDPDHAPGHGPDRRSSSRRAAKPFEITDEGRAHLEESEAQVEALIERLERHAARERASAGPAIGRAVKNLMTALSHRIGRDGLDEELLHEIAAILDEAAQRIERVK